MPGGLDEAAAILTFVEVGFSVAKALKTYIENYKDAPSDIKQLARDLESTMGYVKELEGMLEKNEKAPVLKANAVGEAQRCVDQANVVVKGLVGLLTRGNKQEVLAVPLKPEDLDMSRLQQFTWPLQRNAFVKVKNELQSLTSKIMMFLALYASIASSSKFERDLYSTQALSAAFAVERAVRSGNPEPRRARFADHVAQQEIPDGGQSPQLDAAVGLDGSVPRTLEDTVIEMHNFESNIRQKVQDEQEQRKLAAQELLRIQEESKAVYRQSLVDQLTQRKRKDVELKARLHDMFGVLPEEQVKAFINHQQREEDVGDDIFQFIKGMDKQSGHPDALSDGQADSIISIETGNDSLGKVQGRLRRLINFVRLPSSNDRRGPALLKNDSELPPLYLGFLLALKEQKCIMTSVAVPYSLQKTLQKSFRKTGARYNSLMNTTLHVYRNLHPKVQQRLDKWLKVERSENERAWTLCHACTWFGHKARHPVWEALYGTATSDPRLSAPMIDTENVLVVFRYLETIHQRHRSPPDPPNLEYGIARPNTGLRLSEVRSRQDLPFEEANNAAQQAEDPYPAHDPPNPFALGADIAAIPQYGPQQYSQQHDAPQPYPSQQDGADFPIPQQYGPQSQGPQASIPQPHDQHSYLPSSQVPQSYAAQSYPLHLPTDYSQGPAEQWTVDGMPLVNGNATALRRTGSTERLRKLENDFEEMRRKVKDWDEMASHSSSQDQHELRGSLGPRSRLSSARTDRDGNRRPSQFSDRQEDLARGYRDRDIGSSRRSTYDNYQHEPRSTRSPRPRLDSVRTDHDQHRRLPRYTAGDDDLLGGYYDYGLTPARRSTYDDYPRPQDRARPPSLDPGRYQRMASAQRQYVARTSRLANDRERSNTRDRVVEEDLSSADESALSDVKQRKNDEPSERRRKYPSQFGDRYYDTVTEELQARRLRDLETSRRNRQLKEDEDGATRQDGDVGSTVSGIVQAESITGKELVRWKQGKRPRKQDGISTASSRQEGDLLHERNRKILRRLQERYTLDEFSGAPEAAPAMPHRQATVTDIPEDEELAGKAESDNPGIIDFGYNLSHPASEIMAPARSVAGGGKGHLAGRPPEMQQSAKTEAMGLSLRRDTRSLPQRPRSYVTEPAAYPSGNGVKPSEAQSERATEH
ncbi:hypothetical protein LTR49_017437 [Elasticomyces elasticus]|nr:hypothetical protein LTR49_017437 [Elasticomyces elasticus]